MSAGPIIRLAVAVLLLVFLAIRGPRTGMPPVGLIVIALGLILVAAEQVRRIWISRRPPMEEDAILGLMAMGERRADAEHLLDRTKQANPNLKTTDALLREMLRMRTVRA